MKTYINPDLTGTNILSRIILAIMLSLALPGFSQSGDKGKFLQMIEQDRTTLDVIAGYNEDIQRHILQIAQTPEALNKIEELQKRSQSEFRNIIDQYDRDAQSAFYEMARYPNLITDLVSNGQPSSSDVNRIAAKYPEDIQPIAQQYGRRYFDVFVRIDRLNNEIDRAFQLYLEPYSSRTREGVNVLLGYPEIVTALNDDMSFTSLMGDVYSQDPRWTERYLAQVSRELGEQKERDLDAYRNQITNDPEAYNEMLDASDRFARENNEVRYINNSPNVEVTVINSYPFWYGYPYWYSAPYWRPRPIYYHTGFYRNYYGNVVFVGLPSYHFLHWQTHYHPTMFPHLSYNYYSYYENHYARNYRNSQRPVPYHGFYSSIERNVIHNPRVNNSTLERIDKQRGQDIVRKPNRMDYGSSGVSGRGQTSGIRRSDGSGTINRQGSATTRENVSGRRDDQTTGSGRSGSVVNRNGSTTTAPGNTGSVNRRQNTGTSGSVNRNGSSTPNQGNGSVNRRQYNTTDPGRTEGPVNRRSSDPGSGTIRREAAPAVSSPDATPSRRSDEGTYINRGNNGNSGYNPGRTQTTTTPSATRQRQESSVTGSGSVIQQQRSSGVPQRRENAAQSQSSGRVSSPDAPSRIERSSAPARRESPSVSERTSERSAPVQRESRATVNQAPDRGAARETPSSTSREASSGGSRETGNSRRQR